MLKKSKKLAFWVILFLISFSIIANMLWYAPQPKQQEDNQQTQALQVYRLANQQQQQIKQLHAKIKANREITLSAYHRSKVKQIMVEIGDIVAKDTSLLKLDTKAEDLEIQSLSAKEDELHAQIALKEKKIIQSQQSYQQQQKMHSFTKSRLERNEKLYKSKTISIRQLDEVRKLYEQEKTTLLNTQHLQESLKAELDILKNTLKQQQLSLEQAQLQRDKANINAPYIAKVASIAVEEGEDVSIGQNLISLIDTMNWDIIAFIPSKWIAYIKQAEDITTINAWTTIADTTIQLQAKNIVPDRQYPQLGQELHLSLQDINDRKYFHHQQAILINIGLPAPENTYVVPPSALVLSKYIYIVDSNNYIRRIEVKVVGNAKHQQELWPLIQSTELYPGMQIVYDGAQNHMSNTKVSAIKEII